MEDTLINSDQPAQETLITSTYMKAIKEAEYAVQQTIKKEADNALKVATAKTVMIEDKINLHTWRLKNVADFKSY